MSSPTSFAPGVWETCGYTREPLGNHRRWDTPKHVETGLGLLWIALNQPLQLRKVAYAFKVTRDYLTDGKVTYVAKAVSGSTGAAEACVFRGGSTAVGLSICIHCDAT